LSEVVRSHAAELLTRQTVQNMVDIIKESSPAVVEEMLKYLSLGDIQKVLQNLVTEKVPVRDLAGIFETLADYGRSTQSADFLSEKARESLGKVIVSQYIDENTGELTVLTLSPEWEKKIKESVKGNLVEGWTINIAPEQMQELVRSVGKSTEVQLKEGFSQVILAHPEVRFYVRKIIERAFSNIAILGYNELPGNVRIKTVGVVE
jgi:flagellar biosynthesis protein FlhA